MAAIRARILGLLALLLVSASAGGVVPANVLRKPPLVDDPSARTFVVLDRYPTRAAAIKRWTVLRNQHFDTPVAVFNLGGSKPFAIVVASYVTSTVAAEVAKQVVKTQIVPKVERVNVVPPKRPKPEEETWVPAAVPDAQPFVPKGGLAVVTVGSLAGQLLSAEQAYEALQNLREKLDLPISVYEQPRTDELRGFCALYDTLTEADAEVSAVAPRDRETCAAEERYLVTIGGFQDDAGVIAVRAALLREGRVDAQVRTVAQLQEAVRTYSGAAALTLDLEKRPEHRAFISTKGLVKRCIAEGNQTVADLAWCSGVLLRDQAFSRCLLESECEGVELPEFSGVEQLNAYLMERGIDPAAALTFQKTALGALGDPSRLVGEWKSCVTLSNQLKDAKDDPTKARLLQELTTCNVQLALNPKELEAFHCMSAATSDAARAACVNVALPEGLRASADCIAKAGDSAARIAGCLPDGDKVLARVTDATDCVKGAGTQDELIAKCVAPSLSPEDRARLDCLARGDAVACVAQQSGLTEADIAKAKAVAACLETGASNTAGGYACLGTVGGVPAETIQSCWTALSGKSASVLDCMALDERTREQVKIAQCLAQAHDAITRTSCLAPVADANTQRAITCVAAAGGDRARMALCLAPEALPPEFQQAAQCAGSSSGYVDFALCAGGASMNEEMRIAVQCAANSGGQPYAFAACAAGQLTVRELTKCIGGEIGKDCFGPNNTLVKGVSDLIELEKEFATNANRELKVAVENVARETQKAIDDARREVETAERNAREEIKRAEENLQRSDVGKALGTVSNTVNNVVNSVGNALGVRW